MSLAPGEQRTLEAIESHLCRSDPGLVAMFARFTAEGMHMRPPLGRSRRCGPRLRGNARIISLVAISVTLLIACAVVGVIAATHGAASGGGHGSGASTAGIYLPRPLCSGRVACSRLFSDSARLYTSARWAVVRFSISCSPLSVR